jgi:plastocyanin
MKLKLLLIPVVALAGVLGVSTYASAAHVPTTRTISVGGGGDGVAANDFFPDEITIQKSDTIHFSNTYAEPHTVTFIPQIPQPMAVPALLIPNPDGPGQVFNPLATTPTNTSSGAADFDPHAYFNSGFLMKDASTDVTFNVVGDFKFICLFHPGMELAVSVVSTPITIATQDALDKKGAAQRDAFITAGKAIAAGVTLTKTTDTSGMQSWSLQVGATQGQSDVVQFLPPGPLNISTGDKVTWTSATDTPHTVTFGDLSNPIGMFGKFLAISPAAALPSGGATYSGGNANSGLMDKTGQVPGGSSYSLTFTKAGTYTYACLLHADQGMKGTIVVSDKAAAPAQQPAIKPPNTGTGTMAGSGGGGWLPALLVLGIAGVALLVAGTRAAVKRDA